MLHIVAGDLLDPRHGFDALVNPCNTVGACGRGLSQQIADRYPETVPFYRQACQHGWLTYGGDLHSVFTRDGLLIINLATKQHWRNPSQLPWIKRGLSNLRALLESDPTLRRIGLPPLGAGLGGLDGRDVLALVQHTFAPHDDAFEVFFFLPA